MATPTYNAAGSGHVYDAGATTYTLAFSAAAGSNRILEVWVGNGGAASAAAPTGVTWGGVAMTSRGSHANAATTFRQTKWYIKEADFPSGATGNIVATWSGNQAYRGIVAVSHADVSQTAPFRNAAVTAQIDYNELTPDLAVSSATGDVVTAGLLHAVDAAGMTALAVTAGTERTETSIISGAVVMGGATVAGASTATIEWTRTGGAAASAGLMLGESLMGPVLASPTVGTLRYVGQTPTVSTGSAPVVVTPSVGTLRYVGQTPTVTSPAVVAPSVGTLRITGNTPTLPVSGGARTALIFPSNGGTAVRFRWSGTGDFPDIQPLTLLWRHYPVQQTGYYTTFFHSRTDGSFVGDQTYFGCHPYPPTGGASGTDHNWEIAIEGEDDITDENGNSTVVTKGAWYSQAASTRSNGAGQSIVDYYWDLATAATRRISHTTADGQLTNAATAPGLTFGCASWNDTENLSGRLRGLQIYTAQLSEADIEALSDCEYDAEVVAVCAARSITSLWYLNCNPTPTDITDKSGNGNDPAWVGAARPTLWLEVLPSVGTLRFDGQQPTVSVTSSAAVTPSVGTLRVVGQAPTVAFTDHVAVAPSVGTLRVVGAAPTVAYTDHVSVTPSVGTYRFDGQQPSVTSTAAQTVAPSVGTFRLDGQTPSVGFTHSVAPSVGTVRFDGLQPSVAFAANQWAAPSIGTYRFDGLQPTVSYTDHMAVAPSVGTFRFEGGQPTVAFTANQWTTPSVGSLLFAGQQPSATVSEPGQVSPLVGTLRFAGQQPSVGYTHSVAPSVGSVQFAGQQPSLTATGNAWVAPTVGEVHLAGYAPVLAVTANQWTVPSAGELRFDGQQPTLTEGGDKTTEPSVGTIRFVGYAPSALNSGDVRYTETPAGGGRRARRRRYVVEVDGQEFVTDSLLEARELLRRATVIAEQRAPQVADAVVAQAIAKAHRVGKAQPVDVPMPVIRAPRSLKPEVDALKAVYREAAEAAELRMLMALQAERDDEETLLLLM